MTPAPYSGVELVDTHERHFTGPDGSFAFRVEPGQHHIRVRQIGFVPRDTTVLITAGAPPELVIRMISRTVQLSKVTVTTPKECVKPGVDSAEKPALFGILAAVRENAARELLLRHNYPFEYAAETVLDTAARDSSVTRREAAPSPPVIDTLFYRSDSMLSYARGRTVFVDLTDWRGARERMRLPSTVDFADDKFVSTHCFDYDVEETGEYSISFRPLASIQTPDVEGKVTLDSVSSVIRTAIFRLTHPEAVTPGFQRMEVQTTYHEIAPKIVIAEAITTIQMFRAEDSTAHVVTERQTARSLRFLVQPPAGVPLVLEFTAPPRPRGTGERPPQGIPAASQ